MFCIIKKFSILIGLALVFTNASFSASSLKEITAGGNNSSPASSPKELKSASKAGAEGGNLNISTLQSFSSPELQRHSLGVGLGQTFLQGDLRYSGRDQITWDLLYAYSASHSFDFFTDFHVSNHELKNMRTRLLATAMGIKGKLLDFDAFIPYATAGFGFYAPKVTRYLRGNLIDSKTRVAFGYHIGLGSELRLNNHVSIGVRSVYHNPFDVPQDDQPEVEGSYFKLMMLAMYAF